MFIQRVLVEQWTMHVSCIPFDNCFPHNLRPIDDDYAVAEFARAMGKPADIVDFLYQRALSAPFTLYNNESGFMEARNANGSWAGESQGWTEGDKWAYSFDVVHDVTTLIEKRGGRESFVLSLDQHFQGGHNDHTNEVGAHLERF